MPGITEESQPSEIATSDVKENTLLALLTSFADNLNAASRAFEQNKGAANGHILGRRAYLNHLNGTYDQIEYSIRNALSSKDSSNDIQTEMNKVYSQTALALDKTNDDYLSKLSHQGFRQCLTHLQQAGQLQDSITSSLGSERLDLFPVQVSQKSIFDSMKVVELMGSKLEGFSATGSDTSKLQGKSSNETTWDEYQKSLGEWREDILDDRRMEKMVTAWSQAIYAEVSAFQVSSV